MIFIGFYLQKSAVVRRVKFFIVKYALVNLYFATFKVLEGGGQGTSA